MNFIKKFLNKFFLNKNEKDLKDIKNVLDKIKEKECDISILSDDDLRNKTFYFKNIIKKCTDKFINKEKELLKKIEKNSYSISFLENIYSSINEIKKQSYYEEQKILTSIIPESFSVLKETAKRFKDKKLVVKSTYFDKELSKIKSYVVLDGDKAIWDNKWNAYGKKITWDMVYYDVQLMGGIVLHQGKIAEMATGEGKTFVATLSAYLNSLSGKGVHIVTVNNYLSRRDSEWMAPIMEFHGLKVDCIDNYPSYNISMRKKAYQADITYGTNNEFGFDYLRDNMSCNKNNLVQRKLNYAIVDEIDSVLIDEARTPLIISGSVDSTVDKKKEFEFLRNKVKSIVEEQNFTVNKILNQSRIMIKNGYNNTGGFKLLQAYRGLPKKESLIKFLSEKNIRSILHKTEILYMQDYVKNINNKVDKDLYFVIDEKNNTVELTDKGFEFLSKYVKDSKFFILPDINLELFELEKKNFLKQEKLKEKEKLIKNFSLKSQRIHVVNQLLKAYTLFKKNIDYIVLKGKVKIVDEQTGRVMEGRRYSNGLHQAIEAKENLYIESSSQTLATITLQNYFRMYNKISGMTGTAETESGEFWHIYNLDVVIIPSNKPLKRIDNQDIIFKTRKEKYNAIIRKIIYLSKKKKCPVLVGTTSVEVSEFISRALKLKNISHNVLNAKMHEKEAEIIEKAGLPGSVTIATNMAGRGTDIKLSDFVINNGGLSVLGTERHDSRRVDNQLRGRSGRQGNPGNTQFYVSLEDYLIRLFFDPGNLSKLMDRFGHKEGDIIQHPLITKSIKKAQKKIEDNNFSIRKRLLDYDDVINKQREFIYKKRRNALKGGYKLNIDIYNMIYVLLDIIISINKSSCKLEYKLLNIFGIDIKEYGILINKKNNFINDIHKIIIEYYNKNKKIIINKINPIIFNIKNNIKNFNKYDIQVLFKYGLKEISSNCNFIEYEKTKGKILLSRLEKFTILYFIDKKWKKHLLEMDSLRYSVQNAVFEQKDPLIVYKQNAFNLFQDKIYNIYENIISFLFKSTFLKENILCIPKFNIYEDYYNKKIGRNKRVNIIHLITGEIKKMKFKQAELYIKEGKWIIENIT